MALDRLAQADAFRASAANLAQKLGAILGDWVNITRKPVPSSGNCSGSSCRTG
jgi:hypothetical protein